MKIQQRLAGIVAGIMVIVVVLAGLYALQNTNETKSSTIDFNQAMVFDGHGDYIQVSHNPAHNLTVFTVEAWVNPAEIRPGWQTIVAKDAAGQRRNFGFWMTPNTRTLHVSNCGGGDLNNYYSTGELALNTWTHIAMTFDGQRLTVYLNGKVDGSYPPVSSNCATDADIWIGGYRPNPGSWSDFAGKITDVRIWGIVRTPAEIQGSMNQRLSGNEPGLVDYWTLADSTTDKVIDLTGNHDGIIFR